MCKETLTNEKSKMDEFIKMFPKHQRHAPYFLSRTGFITQMEMIYDKLIAPKKSIGETVKNIFAKFSSDKDAIPKETTNEEVKKFVACFCGAALKDLYTYGLFEAFTQWDMRHLLNVLYQSSRNMAVGKRTLASWGDHSIEFYLVIAAFAANDVTLAKSMLPHALGASKNRHPTMIIGTNLIMALMYNDENAMNDATQAAVKWLSSKRSVFDKTIVEFLLTLAEKDLTKASESLKGVCEGTRKVQDKYFISPLEKHFCQYAHGLYNFAYFVLPKEDFMQLKQPDDKGFIKEFANFNIENNFPKGELFFTMQGKLSLLNVILETDQPETKLICKKTGGNKSMFYTDSTGFYDEFVEKILQEKKS